MVAKERHTPLECVVEEGHAGATGEGGQVHAAGLGIELAHGTMTVIKVENGQCKRNGVQVGMAVVGVNGSPLLDILYDSGDPMEFGEYVNAAQKPLIINFNAMPGAPQRPIEEVRRYDESNDEQENTSANTYRVELPASADADTQKAQNDQLVKDLAGDSLAQEFRELMMRGVLVQKQHSKGSVLNKESQRVLYMDTNYQTIICGKAKGARTNKVFSVHDIHSVEAAEEDPRQLQVRTKSGVILKCKVSNTDYRDSLVSCSFFSWPLRCQNKS